MVAPGRLVRRLVRFGPKKAAGLVALVAIVVILWVLLDEIRHVWAVGALAMAGLVAAVVVVEVRRLRRRRPRVRPEPPKRTGHGPAYDAAVTAAQRLQRSRRSEPPAADGDLAALVAALGLDGMARLALDSAAPTGLRRTPLPLGTSALFLNHVEAATGAPQPLVEKGMWADNKEAVFWREAPGTGLVLADPAYQAVAPVHRADAGPFSVLYFPYLPALHQDFMAARVTFRKHLPAVVRALARLNANNAGFTTEVEALNQRPFRRHRPRPTIRTLRRQLGVSARESVSLRRQWEAVDGSWGAVWEAYKQLPTCFCHNDFSPGNAVHVDGATRLLDFGLAGVGPIGSDLHCVFRWAVPNRVDLERAEELLAIYAEELSRCGIDVPMEDLRLAAWTAFYLRYSNPDFSSTRKAAFTVALRQMSELIEGRRSREMV